MNQTQEQNISFPDNNEKLTKQECAIILQKAFALSPKYKKYKDLAKVAGFSRQTLGDYLYARHKPPKDKWLILRELLLIPSIHKPTSENIESYQIVVKKAEHLKALKLLMTDFLEFFRDATADERQVLKKVIPGNEVGYVTGLFAALYDEDQLKIWLTFSRLNEGEKK